MEMEVEKASQLSQMDSEGSPDSGSAGVVVEAVLRTKEAQTKIGGNTKHLVGGEVQQRLNSSRTSTKGLKGVEHAARINYLFQASDELLTHTKPSPGLAQHYGLVLKTIAEKTSAKLDFTLKRFFCKNCNTTLLPGVNMKYRLKRRKKGKNSSRKRRGFPTQVITCKSCGEVKKFPTNPQYQLKAETHGSLYE